MRTVLGLTVAAAIVVGQGAAAMSAAEFSYAVKFVCGSFLDDDPLEPVVPGLYLTAISVGNPNGRNVEFSYDVAFTFGNVPFLRAEDEIGERDARRLDCDSLFDDLDDDAFLKGSCISSPTSAWTSGRSTRRTSSAPVTRSASMPSRSWVASSRTIPQASSANDRARQGARGRYRPCSFPAARVLKSAAALTVPLVMADRGAAET